MSNGLALRSDLHTLYDRGYIGVDPHHRLRVSPLLSDHFGNGVELYGREAQCETIRLPDAVRNRPDPSALEWHMDEVFLSA